MPIHVFTRTFGGLSKKVTQGMLGWENLSTCTEDKCNHYQIFFAVKATQRLGRGCCLLNLSHCSLRQRTNNNVYMHWKHFGNKRKQKLQFSEVTTKPEAT